MKYLLSILVLGIFCLNQGCKSKAQADENITIHARGRDTVPLVMEAIYVTNFQSLMLSAGPVRKVIVSADVPFIDSLTTPGKKTIEYKFMMDSFYLIPTKDTSLIIIDSSTKKPILDAAGNKQYQSSFRKPLDLNKAYCHEFPISFPLTAPTSTKSPSSK
jgi:hypothetical protein